MGRRCRSDMLCVNGTSRLVMNTNRCARLGACGCVTFVQARPIGTALMIRSSRRSSRTNIAQVVSSASPRCPIAMARNNSFLNAR